MSREYGGQDLSVRLMSTYDYFLWGYLEETVLENNPQTREVLKANIRREIRMIPVDMCQRVIVNLNIRMATGIRRRGAFIEPILNY